MFKKRLSLGMLVVFVMFTLLSGHLFAATGNLQASIGSAIGISSSIVTVPIKFAGVPTQGISASGLKILFNTSQVTVTAIESGSIVKNPGDLTTNYDNNTGVAAFAFMSANSSGLIKEDGTFASIQFKIVGTPGLLSTIMFDTSNVEVIDENNEDINVTPINGSIKIEGTASNSSSVSPTPANQTQPTGDAQNTSAPVQSTPVPNNNTDPVDNNSTALNDKILPIINYTLTQNYKKAIDNLDKGKIDKIIKTIPDIKQHWGREFIAKLSVQVNGTKIVNGFPDGKFKPNDKVTVEQFIVLTINSLGFKPEKDSKNWSKPFIDLAKQYSLVDTGEFTSYKKNITREQMIKIIVRAVCLTDKENPAGMESYQSKIKDFNRINTSYQKEILYAYAAGITTGMGDGKLAPKDNATRAQACVMIVKLIEKLKY